MRLIARGATINTRTAVRVLRDLLKLRGCRPQPVLPCDGRGERSGTARGVSSFAASIARAS